MVQSNVIRYDLQAGTIGASLGQTDTTINLGAAPSFPTLDNAGKGDYVPLTLINATSLGGSEIVYMTGFTAGNSTGQVIRGQESTLGAGNSTTWALGASWEHSPTAVDLVGANAILISSNTTGTTASITAGTITLAGGNNITLSQASGNGITISQLNRAISMYPVQPMSTILSNTLYSGSQGAGGNTSLTTVSAWCVPMPLDTPLIYNEIRIPALMSATTTVTSVNWSATQGISLGLFTKTLGSLSLVSSYSHKELFSHASTNTSGSGSATWNASWGGSATQHTTAVTLNTSTATAAGYWTALTGSKMVQLMTGSSATLPEDQYFMVVAASWSTAGSALSGGYQSFGQASGGGNLTHLQDVGLTSTGGTTGIYPLMGIFSYVMSSNSLMPITIATANITTSSNNASFVNRSLYVHFLMRTT